MPSYSLFLFGQPPELFAAIAQQAEREGFEALWIGDHLVWPADPSTPYPYAGDGASPYSVETHLADVWMTIAHLAPQTERIKLGTGVLIAPLRHPLVIARAAQTAQTFAPGRILLGVGAGWLEEEYELLGIGFRERGRRLGETAEILRRAWRPEPLSHQGEFWSFEGADLGPRPADMPPLIMGGFAEPALRRAAIYGDGWLGTGASLEAAENVRERIEAIRSEAGVSRPFGYRPRLESVERDLVGSFAAAGFDDLAIHLRDLVPVDASLDTTLKAIAAAGEAFRDGQES